MKNLILICGGQSPEHDISIRSVKNILAALDRKKYSVRVINISRAGKWFLMNENELEKTVAESGVEIQIKPGNSDCFFTAQSSLGMVDIIFPVLHGPNGEDGSIQGLFQMLDIPFVGSGVLGSAVCMDKDMTKKILMRHKIKVAEWMLLRRGISMPTFREVVKRLGEVVFVKPANMGSSVGVSRVTDENEWKSAIAKALSFDRKVLAEKLLVGRELECAVLGNRSPVASGVGEVRCGEVYSYDEKYAENSTAKTIIPAQVSESELRELRETAITAHKALECKGLSRVDMFLTDSGEVFVNEVNTMPGFTDISMYPKLWEHEGIGYSDLLDKLIELALESS